MAKPRPTSDGPKQTASQSSVAILVAGAIIVIVLVAFSFSRSLKTPVPTASPVAEVPPAQAPAQTTSNMPAATPQDSGAPLALPPAASPRGEVGAPISPTLPPDVSAAPTAAQLASVPRIEDSALLQELEKKDVTVIDVRDADSYRARHIPGALHIPLSFIAGEVSYLPKDKPIVTYCT